MSSLFSVRSCKNVIALTLILNRFVILVLLQAYREVVLLQASTRTIKIGMAVTR